MRTLLASLFFLTLITAAGAESTTLFVEPIVDSAGQQIFATYTTGLRNYPQRRYQVHLGNTRCDATVSEMLELIEGAAQAAAILPEAPGGVQEVARVTGQDYTIIISTSGPRFVTLTSTDKSDSSTLRFTRDRLETFRSYLRKTDLLRGAKE